MKRYSAFINENKINDEFLVDYEELKKVITKFEHNFESGYKEQFTSIINRTPEDVESISKKNTDEMKQKKELETAEKEAEIKRKTESEKINKVKNLCVALSEFSKLKSYKSLQDSTKQLLHEVTTIKKVENISSIQPMVKKVRNEYVKIKNAGGISKEDKMKKLKIEDKEKTIKEVFQLLYNSIGLKIEKPKPVEKPVEKSGKENFKILIREVPTEGGVKYLTKDGTDVTSYVKKNPEKFRIKKEPTTT